VAAGGWLASWIRIVLAGETPRYRIEIPPFSGVQRDDLGAGHGPNLRLTYKLQGKTVTELALLIV
jgi:hypothetical protein